MQVTAVFDTAQDVPRAVDRRSEAAGRPDATRPRDILQDQIVDVWERLLQQAPIGVEEDFFALGATSEQATSMFDAVEALTGEKLQWSDVQGSPTVRNLGHAIVARLPRDPVLEIQAGDRDRPPLFFLHGDLCGAGYYVRELARGLPRGQPVYVLQQHGMHGEDLPPSVEAMAADHLSRLRERWPSGPFYLGGHCNGAVIAFEMARHLAREGRAPAQLLMIEPPLRAEGDAPPAPPPPRLAPEKRSVPGKRGPWLFSVYCTILFPYRLRPYDGRVTVLWARQGRLDRPEVRALLKSVAPRITMRTVPGQHISAVGRYVQSLAAEMKACLDDACGGES